MKIHIPLLIKVFALGVGTGLFGSYIASPKGKTQIVKVIKVVRGARRKKNQDLEPETDLAGN
jgi:hypothetical protein